MIRRRVALPQRNMWRIGNVVPGWLDSLETKRFTAFTGANPLTVSLLERSGTRFVLRVDTHIFR
jgi:hypothetical protein